MVRVDGGNAGLNRADGSMRWARPSSMRSWVDERPNILAVGFFTPDPFPNFRLRSRGRLIAATLLLQAAIIGLGGMGLLHVMRNGVSQRVQEERCNELAHEAERVAGELKRKVTGPIVLGNDGWRVAQDLVEGCQLTGGATLFLLDDRGRLVCHPALRRNPNMRRVDYAEQSVRIEPSGETWELGNFSSQTVLMGEADFLSGRVAIAACYDPDRKVRIVVHQPVQGLLAAGDRATAGLLAWGGPAALLVLAISAGGSIVLMRRYDSALARADADLEREVDRRTQAGLTIRNGLIFGLAKLADYRDTDTGRHLERICRYCEIIATEIRPLFQEIDDGWIERLKLASSMHDIGKVGIADRVLLKPGALTDAERQQMQRHVAIGVDTLRAIQDRVGDDELLAMAIDVTLQHHEKVDGTGYPTGLKGEEISLAARIVALADVYDALTSHRVYKIAMSHAEASAIIRRSRGSHFDAMVVDAFVHREAFFARVCDEMQTADGERCSLELLSRAALRRAA